MEEKLAASGKGSWFNQDVSWHETEEGNTTRKITRSEGDTDFQSDSCNDDGIYSGSSRSPYVVLDLKLLEAALAKIAGCHECGSKISLEEGLDQRQIIGAQLKLYCGFIKRTFVKFNSTEKQAQFYYCITQGHYYSFDSAICFTDTILFSIFSFRQSLSYRYLIPNIPKFLLNVLSRSML